MTVCPICERADLVPAGQMVNLQDVLAKWEATAAIKFPEEVWEDYTEVTQPLVLQTCPSCSFGRFDPPITGTKSFYAAIEAAEYFNPKKWEFERAIRQIRRSGARSVLDVGCGSGFFVRQLRSERPDLKVSGADLNSTLLKNLAADGFGTLEVDLNKIARLRRRFDAICLFQVLEHVEDPVGFLGAFIGLLRPGGDALITTPDASGPIRHFADYLTEVPPHHVTRWSEETFRTLLPKLGLTIISVEREPLPNYLWDTYLPVLWGEDIWPARVLDPIAVERGHNSLSERLNFGASCLRSMGLERLHAVPGHTIFISARRNL
jgi:SAM-dependent methyltransferase